jgi:hypothetical protein
MFKKVMVMFFVCLLFIPAVGAGFLFADDLIQNDNILSIEFAADNFETLRLFDEKGSLIPNPEFVTGIQAGWIIQTESTGIELYSKGTGTLHLSPSTLISVDLISVEKAEFFLLKGKLRFISETDNYPVYISTPAAQYTINTPGEYILLSENTENFYVLEGKADVYNRITQKSSTIEAMVAYESLNRKEPVKSFEENTAELLQETLPLQFFKTPDLAVTIPEPAAEPEEVLVSEEIEFEPVIIAAVIDEGLTVDVPDETILIPVEIEEIPIAIEEEPISEEEAIIIEIVEEPVIILAEEEPATPPAEVEPVTVIAVPLTTETIPEEPIEIAKEEPEYAPVIIDLLPPETEETEPDIIETVAEEPLIESEPELVPLVIAETVPILVPVVVPGSIDSLMSAPAPQIEEILLPEDAIIEEEFPEPIVIIAETATEEVIAVPIDILPVEPEVETVVIEVPVIIIADTLPEPAPETVEVPEKIAPEAEIEIIIDEPVVLAEAAPESSEEMEATPPETAAAIKADSETAVEIEIIVDEPIVIAESVPESTEDPEQQLIIMAEPAPIVPASYEPNADDNSIENILTAGIILEASSMHTDQSTEYESSYLKTVAEPWIKYNNFSFGLHIPLIFDDYPLSIANWYLPRGNNPYDFGTGYSSLASFEAIRDLSLDILSLTGYANYRSSTGSFLLNADDHTTLSMGTGALISGLDPMIDDPFIRRIGLQNTLTTPYFDYELLINDLSHAELFALRLAAKPMGNSFPMEIGLYAISDISLSPNKFVIVPGIDITIPLAYSEALSLNVYTDFSLLMLADETGFHTESFFSEGSLYNYLAVLGARGKTGDFSFALSGAYQNALLTQGIFGTDYSWRRAGFIDSLFDNADYSLGKSLSGTWTITAEIGYDWGIFDALMSYRFNFDENFAVSSWNEDRDEISFSATLDTEPLRLEFGLRKRGFASTFSPSGPSDLQEFLFNEQTQLFAGASYATGSVTVNAELSGSAQYQVPESSAILNNIDNQLTDSEESLIISPTLSIGTKISISSAGQNITSETSTIDSTISETNETSNYGVDISSTYFHPLFDQLTGVYNGPYTQLAISPYYNSDNFSFGLNAAITFNGNPLSIANWYLPRGNNPYDFGTGYTSFEAIRDLSLDILSLIGYANYRSSTGSFLLNADDHTTLSMGTGALISGLDPMIDDPFIRRVGFQNTLTTPYFDYELLINDLSHAELFGLRLAAKPLGQSFPMEIGLYAISDISLSPNKYVIVPGIDVKVPVAFSEVLSLNVYADFSLLMLADDTGFHTESFFSDSSLYNYLAVLGARGKTGDFSFALSGAYQNALLTQGIFGTDYSWRRAGFIDSLFDDADYSLGKALSGSWAVTAEIGYDWGVFDAQMSYQFNLDENFAVSSWDEDRDEISFSASLDTEPFIVEFGFRQRGFASTFSPSGPSDLQEFLFNEQTQLFAGATYTTGRVTVNAELLGSAQYQAPESSAILNNIDNQFTDSTDSLIISPTLSIGTKIKLF